MKVVIIGGRGNGTVIASTIEDCRKNNYDIECVGFLSDSNEKYINNYPILGKVDKESWMRLSKSYFFIYALSSVKKAKERYNLLLDLEIPLDRFATIIHPSAVVSQEAIIGKGVVLMPFSQVGPNSKIGNHSLLLSQSFVGHDTTLGEMVFVANNATIGGNLNIGNGAHIGSNSSILENLNIGEFSVIGLGSVVVKDVSILTIVVGNPAKKLKEIEVKRRYYL